MNDDDLLTRKEAAIYLTKVHRCRISHYTLARLACNGNGGKGPPFYHSGWRTVSYLRKDLDEWASGRVTRVE